MLLTIVAFLLAIGLLVAVHEWGHFAMARACGVKVLTFSIGFGPRLLGWTSQRTGTVYQLGCLPLGGFVKMLDEREAPVPPDQLAQAFNRQALHRRAAVVAAGPLANLCLAVLIYSAANWWGVSEPEPVVAKPPAASLAAQAGFVGGERILQAGAPGEPLEPVASFEDFRWRLTQAALARQALALRYQAHDGQERAVTLSFATLDTQHADAALFAHIGFVAPLAPARIGDISPDSAAQQAGLQPGDLVLAVDGQRMVDASQLRALIRQSGATQMPAPQQWLLERAGQPSVVRVTPRREADAGQHIGRVGAMIGSSPAMLQVRYGFGSGIAKAVRKVWELSALTLRVMGQMLVGESSVRNLSGPITIADYAGRSASMGAEPFALFLALISVSLGVLNLLPLPVLDGGHLLYYGWEAVTGRAVSEPWLTRLQTLGFAVLMLLMAIAVFNDLSRLLS